MSAYDHARYVGHLPGYRYQVAEIRPHFETHELPIEKRKVLVKWRQANLVNHASPVEAPVGTAWHVMPASDFQILVRI